MRLPRVLRRIPRNQLALAAGLVMAAAVLAALLAPYLPLLDPDAVDTPNRLRPPGSPGHLLGTDEFGRDMLARLDWGGRVDTVVMRLTDILMAFPYILLAIAIVAGLGPGLANAMVAIRSWAFPLYTRLARGLVLSLREREFVEAARALGSSDRSILRRHLLPHLLAPVVVAWSLDVGAKILATAGLSFLGLGTQPPTADWAACWPPRAPS